VVKGNQYGRTFVTEIQAVLEQAGVKGDENWPQSFGDSIRLHNWDWNLVFTNTTEESARVQVHIGPEKVELLKALTYLKEQRQYWGRF